MSISDEEYDILVHELAVKQGLRKVIVNEIQDLQHTISEINNARRNLPMKPGMYWHPEEGWPAFLADDGKWTDGWGNYLEEVAGEMHLEGVKRVEFVDERA